MTDAIPWLEPHFGRRLAAWRRHRGFRTAASLAERIADHGGAVSESVIQNIEAGRKTDPTISQLAALSIALGVPPVALLAPLGDPLVLVTVPGTDMSMPAFEFDAWWSVGERAIDTLLPNVAVDDRETLRLVREAVSARAELNAWRQRHRDAGEASDRDGVNAAYRGTNEVVQTLFVTSRALADRGLPTDWLQLGDVPELDRFTWVELPTADEVED